MLNKWPVANWSYWKGWWQIHSLKCLEMFLRQEKSQHWIFSLKQNSQIKLRMNGKISRLEILNFKKTQNKVVVGIRQKMLESTEVRVMVTGFSRDRCADRIVALDSAADSCWLPQKMTPIFFPSFQLMRRRYLHSWTKAGLIQTPQRVKVFISSSGTWGEKQRLSPEKDTRWSYVLSRSGAVPGKHR